MSTIDPSMAASLYGKISSLKNDSAITPSSQGASQGISFGDLLRNTAESTVDVMKQSEKVSAQAITGNADLNDVVRAVSSAEITLQTVMAIRDRAVSALQEILRMPI